ncbi:MAG: glutamine synthetase, partial [Candidatus Diapherotrites archaeon]|nr:glutamine synthetase [Candidatus Diapherotrites archaeon]
PKPFAGINGSGMHVHQSLWRNGENAFYDGEDEYGLSATAKSFLAGQMKHIAAITALTNPSVNSYKRLVPGHEAPTFVAWARINRSALIRIPRTRPGDAKATRMELRSPDSSCNPYMAFTAMLAAGLDGIKNKLEPPKPVEENLYEFSDERLRELYVERLPLSLHSAVIALEKDSVVRGALGEPLFTSFFNEKMAEWTEFKQQVSDWELKRYLIRA